MEYPIPIQNIYYLYCYAWNRLDEGDVVDVGGVDSPELLDLFAHVLVGGVRRLIRRGIDRGYTEIEDDIPVLRGKVDVNRSMRLKMQHRPLLGCEFDELLPDVLTNQILKTTISRLTRLPELDLGLAHELRLLMKAFSSVRELRLSKNQFRKVQIHKNNSFYDFLIKICELIHEATLPEGNGTRFRFAEILRDEKKMAHVFEAFVRNFYRLEQKRFQVTPLQLRWDAISESNDLNMLPTMRTDIHLRNGDQRIIIDTKYYRDSLQRYHGKASIRSDNLYQLFAYLRNSEALGSEYAKATGVLMYPAVGEKLMFSAEIQGHPVRVLTINLDQPWQNIRTDLLAAIGIDQASQSSISSGISDYRGQFAGDPPSFLVQQPST